MRLSLAVAILVLFSVMPASANNLDTNFLIKRAGKVIGFHNVEITDTNAGKIVETTIRMRVKFGPIRLFRYDHSAVEEWRGSELILLSSETNNNGEDCFVRLIRGKEHFVIDASGYSGNAPLDATPSSYWDRGRVNTDALINTQTGELIDVTVTDLGRTLAPHKRLAEQFRMVGTLAVDLWYDGPQWVGSNFTIDGEELTYELAPQLREYAKHDESAD